MPIELDRREILMGAFALGTLGSGPASHAAEQHTKSGPSRAGDGVHDSFTPAFALSSVAAENLLGPRIEVNQREWLMKVELDDLLAPFIHRPGIEERAGEYVGKWLHAACLAWRRSGDPALADRIHAAASALIGAQDVDGYLGAYIPRDRWLSRDVWVHSRVLIGLLSVHGTFDHHPSLLACRRIGDLILRSFGTGAAKADIASDRHGPHFGLSTGSILEPMVLLHRATGDPRYLDFCRMMVDDAWEQMHGPRIVSGLLSHGSVEKIADGKAYEMLSCVVGLAEIYRTSGDRRYLKACQVAWQDVRRHQGYPIGTASWAEHFGPLRPDGDYYERAGNWHGMTYCGPGEGCVTTSWLQLTWQMLRLTGDSQYADEIERIIYNAVIGAQSPRTGQTSYYSPLIGRKRYGEVDHGIRPNIWVASVKVV